MFNVIWGDSRASWIQQKSIDNEIFNMCFLGPGIFPDLFVRLRELLVCSGEFHIRHFYVFLLYFYNYCVTIIITNLHFK